MTPCPSTSARGRPCTGLPHLDNANLRTANVIGPTSSALNRTFAMATDLSTQLTVGQIHITCQPPALLLVDGTHWLYRAWRERVPQLSTYLLTTAETDQIKSRR
ncbi:hypothetical protein [Micromonospora sp. NPDC049662]|uniref:hypothetical protein n=1 Tax=Micromonospora sp. NPDC049662 TaxID=3155397 RepID=UPI003449A5DA